ncbi:unnamed protein product [Polarella glacialis]|uniref:Uncharacterized protein n=1 Tax=Polarella glacialis TaxID=89957 RepID=A0A813LFF6_POLGL|nr:unnamed protein product [Polarella glacialis]
MGSGASAPSGGPRLPWPPGARALLSPASELPKGLKISAPVACVGANDVPYWQLGGPSKARLRVTEDESKMLELGPDFTVGLLFRAGAGEEPGYDSLLLGDDNKHWLALPGGDRNTVCCVEGASGKASEVKAEVGREDWMQLFLRPAPDGGTALLGVDGEGLLELGTFATSLIGSKLRNCGWATNEVHIAAIATWENLSWAELSAAVAPKMPAPPTAHTDGPEPTRFRGKVVDLKGHPVADVKVSWRSGGCKSDKEGHFTGMVAADEETQVPEDGASQGSGSSNLSWMSLSFDCLGFAPAASPASLGADNSMKVTMRPIAATATMDSAAGGSLTDPASGTSVTLPANALVYADGTPATGPVIVSLSVIDVTDPAGLASMPGDFSAVGADGADVMLQSLGAVWVGAADEEGKKLELRDGAGMTLDLHTQAKANAEKLGTLPEMWSFDEASGKWELEPSAMKLDGEAAPNLSRPEAAAPVGLRRAAAKSYKKGGYDPIALDTCMSAEAFMKRVAAEGPKSIVAVVTKIGYINCDLAYHHPLRAVMLKGLVLDAKQQPMPGVQVWSTGRDYAGRTADATGKDGRFAAMIAQFDSEVDVEVQHRTPAQSSDKVEVFYEHGRLPKKLDKDLHKLVQECPGQYSLRGDNSGSEGHPTWVKIGNFESVISWDQSRRRWQHLVGNKVLFCRAEGEEFGLPFGDGWLPTAELFSSLYAPKYTRAFEIVSKSFGPFKTGPAGEFVDVGELVIDC